MKLNYTSLQHPVEPVEAPLGAEAADRAPPPAGPRPAAARPPGARRVGGRTGAAGAPGRLRPDRGRGAAGRAVARRRRASRARAARRARHRRARPTAASTRRSAWSGRSTPLPRGWAGRRSSAGPGPGILGSATSLRARRHGGARQRPRRARPGPADPALAAASRAPTRARATAGSATTRRRCSSCCWPRCASRCPRSTSRAGRPASEGRARSTCRASSTRCTRSATTATTWPSSRSTSRLRGERAADADDGPDDRRGPAVLRGGARRRPGAGRGRRQATGLSDVERIGSKTRLRGRRSPTVRIDEFRYPDGSTAEREVVGHPGAVAMVAHDERFVYLVRQPREAVGEEALLELPAGKLDVEGESAARLRPARARRGDRQGGLELARAEALLHQPGLRRGGGDALPGDRPQRRERRVRRGGADRGRRPGRWPTSTARSRSAATRSR